MTVRSLEAVIGHPAPWIVGVLNVTPDSFSDRGVHYNNLDAALMHARQLISDGAHILEIGGEATGPGTSAISADTELSRIEELVSTLAKECFVSVDTFHAATAQRCLQLGAQMINDVSALRADTEMAQVIARHTAFAVLMHSKESGESPHASSSNRKYTDIIIDIAAFLREQAQRAVVSGVLPERIILDPGMGRFLSLHAEDSWTVLRRYHELCERLGEYHVMVAVSRKGFLGGATADRDPISQLVSLHAVRAGARLIRTHNVKLCRQFLACEDRLR